MISFKGVHFPKEVILYAVFFYVRYGVSYRDLEEIMEERGVKVDHATLNRWVINYSPLISAEAKKANVLWRHPGGWMKRTLRSKENGSTCTVPSTSSATPLISCCPNSATKWPLPRSSSRPSTTTASLIKSSWIKAALTMPALRIVPRFCEACFIFYIRFNVVRGL